MRTKNPINLNNVLSILTNDFKIKSLSCSQLKFPIKQKLPKAYPHRIIIDSHRHPTFNKFTPQNLFHSQYTFHHPAILLLMISTPITNNTKQTFTPRYSTSRYANLNYICEELYKTETYDLVDEQIPEDDLVTFEPEPDTVNYAEKNCHKLF